MVRFAINGGPAASAKMRLDFTSFLFSYKCHKLMKDSAIKEI